METVCLVLPPESLLSATTRLADIATAVEQADHGLVVALVRSMDLDACREYWLACGAEAKRRYRAVPPLAPSTVTRASVTERHRIRLGGRDGWRCRYCSIPLTWVGFFADLWNIEELRSGTEVNDLWRVFCQSPDHVVPLSRGGANSAENLVSACGACNYGRMAALLEEVGVENPFVRSPRRDDWAGLLGRPWLPPLD